MLGVGSGDSVVVGAEVVALGADVVSVSGGSGATTVDSRAELITITNAITRPMTRSTATAAAIHNHFGDFGGCGGGGGSLGGYPPCCQYDGSCSVGCVWPYPVAP